MATLPELWQRDEHNQALLRNVRPAGWKNPDPRGRYNLVVLGAGTAGLVTAAAAAGLGARVALIERHLLGGDCLNAGCVPSKAVIRASRSAAEARRAAELGLGPPADAEPDFGAAMRRMRRLRARISREDSAARYQGELGVDVFLGDARFAGGGAVAVEGRSLRFAKAVIATGARPLVPPIPGLEQADPLTNETLFDLTERPRRLGVIGAGPIGCEMAQAFRRLGSRVVVFDLADQVLPREDADAAEIVQRRFLAEGIELRLGCEIGRVEVRGGETLVHASGRPGELPPVAVDRLLVAVGRAPNVEGLELERAGVAYDGKAGVQVNDYLQTTNPRIYAAGDVCMAWKFTHAADAAAKIAVQNALFLRTRKQSSLVMPWCTYTDPEVAHVGLTAREAAARGIGIDTWQVPLEEVNRAVVDGEEEGFVRIHTARGRDRILGATIVAAHAGEMISEITLAMVGGLGLRAILSAIHPYPTQAEGIKRAAGLWLRGRATPRVLRLLRGWMALRR